MFEAWQDVPDDVIVSAICIGIFIMALLLCVWRNFWDKINLNKRDTNGSDSSMYGRMVVEYKPVAVGDSDMVAEYAGDEVDAVEDGDDDDAEDAECEFCDTCPCRSCANRNADDSVCFDCDCRECVELCTVDAEPKDCGGCKKCGNCDVCNGLNISQELCTCKTCECRECVRPHCKCRCCVVEMKCKRRICVPMYD